MKSIKSLSILLLSMFMGSCAMEEVDTETTADAIQLTSSIEMYSRGTSLDEQSTMVAAGQKVGVTITGANAEHVNQPWIALADGTLSNTSTAVYWKDQNIAVTAYQPYNSGWTDLATAKTFTVQTDQSGSGYADSDLLSGTITSSRTAGALTVPFTHKLSKIAVTLTSEQLNLTGATISILNTKPSVSFTPSTGAIGTTASGTATTIKAGVTTAEAWTAAAIIVPQTLAVGTKFIQIQKDGATYTYSLPSQLKCLTGNSYSLTLNVTREQVILSASNVTNWNNHEQGTTDLTEDTPYLTFSSDKVQTLTLKFFERSTMRSSVKTLNELASDWNPEFVAAIKTLEYSVGKGDWIKFSSQAVDFGGDLGDIRIRGKSPYGTSGDDSNADSPYAYFHMGNSNQEYGCTGDIRTLVDYENYQNADCSNARFMRLFENEEYMTSAPDLPSKIVASYAYCAMFSGCSSLTTAPELPAVNLGESCYNSMFDQCWNLEKAPMILPATQLAQQCYRCMFQYCEKLEEAPELPARVLKTYCYSQMFRSCPKLKKIKMMATDITATGCLSMWVTNVSSTGTFIKNSTATWTRTGENGIPTGWTVETATN